MNINLVECSHYDSHHHAKLNKGNKSYEYDVQIRNDLLFSSIFHFKVYEGNFTRLIVIYDEPLLRRKIIKAFYNEGRRDKILESDLNITSINMVHEYFLGIDYFYSNLISSKKKEFNVIKKIYDEYTLYNVGKWMFERKKIEQQISKLLEYDDPLQYVETGREVLRLEEKLKQHPTAFKMIPKHMVEFRPLASLDIVINDCSNVMIDLRTQH